MGDLSALRRLARYWGVQVAYRDVWNRRKTADPEVLAVVLRALGAPLHRAGDAPAALAEIEAALLGRVVAPAVLVWDGAPVVVSLDLPSRRSRSPIEFEIVVTPPPGEGAEQVLRIRAIPSPGSAAARRGSAGERTPCRAALGVRLPPGIHRLRFKVEGARCESLLIVAPRRAPGLDGGRHWGLFLPLYSARSRDQWAIGDFTDLRRLAEWTGAHGGGLLGSLPLFAAFLDEPCDPSPYRPASRLFLNEVFTDVTAVPEFAVCRRAQEIAGSAEFGETIESLRSLDLVDHRRVAAAKRRVILELSRHLARHPGERQEALRAWAAARPEAIDYARFRAAGEKARAEWQNWPRPWRDGRIEPADVDPDVERYHLYAQWIAEEQLESASAAARGAGVRLYLDHPLGVHPSGYDTWRHRSAFVGGLSVGAPPDFVWSAGQNWGFPPLHPEAIRDHRYDYLRAVYRRSLSHAGLIRIDHIMGFHRLYVIPEGGSGTDGVYLRYAPEESYALLLLEASRAGCAVVGEDLGTVPSIVRSTMRRRGLSRMYVAQREVLLHPRRPFAGIPAEALACLNTHDMPPFAGFWAGDGPLVRRELGLVDEAGHEKERRRLEMAKRYLVEDLRRGGWLDGTVDGGRVLFACLKRLAASRARIVLINLEDLWEETRPQNVPGTWMEKPNWRRRARIDLDTLRSSPGLASRLDGIDAVRRRALGGTSP